MDNSQLQVDYEPQRKMRVCSRSADRISELPSYIIENILSRLPLRDAGRTSVLSRDWRYKWVNIPVLEFDCQFLRTPPTTKSEIVFDFFQILSRHRGPLHTFSLCIHHFEFNCSPEFDHVIHFLSGKDIQNLRVWALHYPMPSFLFSMLHLRNLSLDSCILRPPPSFKGFSRLTHLEFVRVEFIADLNNFILNCPLLSHLTLHKSRVPSDFEIDASNLRSFSFRGFLYNILLKNTPILEEARIDSTWNSLMINEQGNTSNFIKVFGSLPLIKSLGASRTYLKYLATEDIPDKLPTSLNHLKVLELSKMLFDDVKAVSCALCLIRSSPYLQELLIKVDRNPYANMNSPYADVDSDLEDNEAQQDSHTVLELMEAQDISSYYLNHLRGVELRHLIGSRSELEFVKFLLSISPVLEKMVIKPQSHELDDHGVIRILNELTPFRRASRNAEVIISGADNVQPV